MACICDRRHLSRRGAGVKAYARAAKGVSVACAIVLLAVGTGLGAFGALGDASGAARGGAAAAAARQAAAVDVHTWRGADDDGAAAAAVFADCNGHAALCARRLDEVAFAGAHNAMSTVQEGWALANHYWSARRALEAGVFALGLDLHYDAGGTSDAQQLSAGDGKVRYGKARRFSELPISRRTLAGLAKAKWEKMTDIQRAALPHALAGRDILGAAKTGSGKTLAFLVAVLERLHRERWSTGDGLGALIVTPTRELALQIFEVLRKVGARHALSAALLTGGKRDFVEEQSRVARMAGMTSGLHVAAGASSDPGASSLLGQCRLTN